jgi:hypothetical protein
VELCRTGEITEETQVCPEGTESFQPLAALLATGQHPSDEPSSSGIVEPPPVPTEPPATQDAPPTKNYEYSVVPFVAMIEQREGSTAVTGRIKRDHPGSKSVPFGGSKSPTWGFCLIV